VGLRKIKEVDMDLNKLYGSNGKEVNILTMVKEQPEWSANRIQEGERFYHELIELKDKLIKLADHLDKPETPIDNAQCRRISFQLRTWGKRD
jgi:hypothetical protein